MRSRYKFLTSIAIWAAALSLHSCADDPIAATVPGSLEGSTAVTLELQGMPLHSAMSRTAGDAVQDIRNLYVLFYNADSGALEEAFTTDASCANTVFDTSLAVDGKTSVDRTGFNPGTSGWNGTAESATQKVTTNEVHVPRGKYRVYVVANVDAFSQAGFDRETIATEAALRGYRLTWNAANVAANDAMFGYFTESATTGYDVIKDSAPAIYLTEADQKLHAWVKRAVSKVTVAFDGTQLNDNVNVYIKKVTVKDIPVDCKLGAVNTPDAADKLITTGESKVYTTEAGVSIGTRVSRREPYFPDFTGYTDDEESVRQWRERVHSETTDALYFFENCQGMSTGEPDADGSWKQQTDNNGNGIPDDRDNGINKDTKAYGTYVEVEAYYTNANFGKQTEGNIIYRFMLGQNTTNDFNAERNNHYKLTMRFKNNANDVDWHIDYNDQPGIYIPEILYVSYTYNTASVLPIRVVGQTVSNLSITINSSNWYPDDSTIPYYDGTTDPTGLATGFLSLTYDENPRVPNNRADENFGAGDETRVASYWANQPNNTTRQYISGGNKVNWSDLDAHGYNVTNRRTTEGQNVVEANIPVFTRPLTIYKWTSWTGANPYYSSSRSGEITISGTVDGQAFSRRIRVQQVRRVENPAGIYRRHNNAEPFDVRLMYRNGEGGLHATPISYTPLVSDGPWRATIYRSSSNGSMTNEANAWFSITAGSQRVSTTGQYIQGDSGTPIEFTYNPGGTIGQNETRNGVIKIEYNNYTCTHYIFVRQGYAPMQLEAGRVYWHSFNLYNGAQETTHPCEAGSFFIRGHFSPAILDANQQGWGEATSTLMAITNDAGTTTGNVSIPILNSGNYARADFPAGSRSLSGNNTTLNPWSSGRVPTLAEWSTLLNENANAQIDRAYGVLYADGATATQTNPDDVYGCLHNDVVSGVSGSTARGMRGTFVYNTQNGRNLFFPIGAQGFGRRKVGTSNGTASGSNAGGVLQYSFGDTFWSTTLEQNRRALLYNLYRNEGAIYWSQDNRVVSNSVHSGGDNGWDINYKSYDFDYMETASNMYSACYLRLVQDTAP